MGRSPKAGQRSAPAAAAYRAGAKILDEATGVTHDYSKKRGVEHSEIMAPARAGAWATDRGQLWNAVEAAERRRDAQLAREFRLSIPHQLDHAARVELVRDWAQRELVSRGMVADVAIHAPHHGGKNYHAHIMATTRHLSADGSVFVGKAREWNSKELLVELRESWAVAANAAAERAGHSIGWTHLSLAAQVELAQAAGDHYTATAKAYAPTVHEGPKVQAVRKALHSQAQAEGVPLLALLDRLEAEGAATGAHDLIRHNELAREQRAAQQELAAAQREEAEARQEQARVIDARVRFEERRRAAQQESSMSMTAAPEAPAMSMGDRIRAAVAERERLREAQEQQALGQQEAQAAQPEPAEAGSQKGASLWEKQKQEPEQAAPAQSVAVAQEAMQEAQEQAPTVEQAAALLEEREKQRQRQQEAQEQLEAMRDQLQAHTDAGPATDGQTLAGALRDLACELVPGFKRLFGHSKHARAVAAHQEKAQRLEAQAAKLAEREKLAERRLAGMDGRPEAELASELADARRSWQRGQRQHAGELHDAAKRLDRAATAADADLRDDWVGWRFREQQGCTGAASIRQAAQDSRDLRDQLREAAQQVERPSDEELLATAGRFEAPEAHRELLHLSQQQAAYTRDLPAQVRTQHDQQQTQQMQQQMEQKQQQQATQRSSSGPRMG